jgi:hypothetical protein
MTSMMMYGWGSLPWWARALVAVIQAAPYLTATALLLAAALFAHRLGGSRPAKA